MSWAAMETAISAGVSPPMGRPMGDQTRSISAAGTPAARSRFRVAATFRRLPMQPMYRAGVARAWRSTSKSASWPGVMMTT